MWCTLHLKKQQQQQQHHEATEELQEEKQVESTEEAKEDFFPEESMYHLPSLSPSLLINTEPRDVNDDI